MFELNEKQQEKLKEWDHKCNIENGAIGGRITFHFTPTGLGVILSVTCVCGAKLDLTEYEYW